MVAYFSGTGNSRYMAYKISELISDQDVVYIPDLLRHEEKNKEYQKRLASDDIGKLGLVFPIYAWDAPRLIYQWLETFDIPKDTYIYAIAVCGENVGNTFQRLEKKLKKKGLVLRLCYSVVSPNNYIVMGRMDVDSKERQDGLYLKMEQAGVEIAENVAKSNSLNHVERGSVPGLMTSVISPLFNHFARSDKAFFANESCTHCGLCEKICPVDNIKLDAIDRLPRWQGHCAMCTACIHRCPVAAIQYGKVTQGKGRYVHPSLKGKM